MSDLTPRYLLDKNVIRHLINGLRLPERMGAEEQLAFAIWVKLRQSGSLLCMSVETSHILQRLPSYREIALVEKTVAVLEAGRYFKRGGIDCESMGSRAKMRKCSASAPLALVPQAPFWGSKQSLRLIARLSTTFGSKRRC